MFIKYLANLCLIYSLIGINLRTIEAASEPDLEPLLGLLRQIPGENFPKESHKDQLKECQKEVLDKSNTFAESIKKLLQDSKKDKEELYKITDKSITDKTRFQTRLDDLMLSNQKLRQELANNELILNRKFDCKPNAFSIKKCQKYCTFPYSYDSCTDSSAKLTFVRMLEDKEGRCIHSSYKNSRGSTCTQIHVVVS